MADGTVVVIENFTSGDLGLQLADTSTQTTANTITGDIIPDDTDPNKAGIQAAADANGNPVGIAGPYEDILGGTAGNDHILSGELNDDIGGDAGNDWIEGGTGSDYIGGGTGDDLIEGGAGTDILAGEDGNDQIYGNIQITVSDAIDNGNNDIDYNVKGDWLAGGSGDDIMVAGTANDVLSGGGGNDLLISGAGDDFILGDTDYLASYIWKTDPSYSTGSTNWFHSAVTTFDWTVTQKTVDEWLFQPVYEYPSVGGADVIYAGNGNDHVWAGAGDDMVYGEGGGDVIIGETGNDILMAGAGDDTVYGDASYLDASLHGDDYIDGDDGNDILYGQGGNDILLGGDGNDTLWGGDGSDQLTGDAGDDQLYGEHGANYIDGGDGNDTLNSGGPGSALYGGAGEDDISAAGGGNYLDGEDGNDTLSADGGDNELFGGAGDDDLSASGGNNYLDGEEGNNTLLATDTGNTLFAGAGDDTLSAGGGSNYLDGGDGTNLLIADGGGNELHGGAGDDTLSASGGGNYLDGGDGNNLLVSDGGGNFLFAGAGIDTLSSTGGNSYLDGGDGDDTLIADGGSNTLTGGAGDDHLSAAGGGNYLNGGAGGDVLVAQGGGNYLNGGDGMDIYVFDAGFGVDHIVDAGSNFAQFNFNFADSGVVIGLGSLMLSFANGDVLHIDGFDPGDPLNTCSISTFQFSDQTLSLQDILDLGGPAVDFTLGRDITGTAEADTLQGTDLREHIYAMSGNDTIIAGGGNDYIEGGDGNDTIDGGTGADVMIGGTGDDAYSVDDASDLVIERLNEGYDSVQSSLSYTLGNHLEELTLTGVDNLDGTGNALDNVIMGNDGVNTLSGLDGNDNLYGEAGNDTLLGGYGDDMLNGGTGADAMAGGEGNDHYLVDDNGDTVTENLNGGIDLVHSSVTYTLGDNIENLGLTGTTSIDGTGNELNNRIDGNDSSNTLSGLAGNDWLLGWGGTDTLLGGTGDDTYFAGDESDVIVENLNEGTDLVNSTVNCTLSANVENLFLTGAGNIGTGNGQDNQITAAATGRQLNYTLSGGAGNDRLAGLYYNDTLDGGTGTDVMIGDYGNDTYIVDNAGDFVYELYNHGIDTVQSSISYTLSAYLENLTLTGVENLNGTGNDLVNILIGNSGGNTLDGGAGNDTLNGGLGADVMMGGAGGDIYYVDTASAGQTPGDEVIESNPSGGIDQVYSTATFILGVNVENLTLTGNGNIDGSGNELGNSLIGNSGDNTLSGGAGSDMLDGGLGADAMDGGDGQDNYYLDNPGDTVTENSAAGGYDQVYATVDFTLGANVEGLNLINSQSGTGLPAIIGTGNDLDNYIIGNDAGNVLSGESGNDYLEGGVGSDIVSGGAGDDSIFGGQDGRWTWRDGPTFTSNDTLDGSDGNDLIDGETGNDSIIGGAGDDTLYGGYEGDDYESPQFFAGNDVIDGGDGNDFIDGESGADTLLGGAGDDHIYGGDDGNATFHDFATDSDVSVSSDDYLDGGDGNDILDGGTGDDTLVAGTGNDTLYGGEDNDVLYGSSRGGPSGSSPTSGDFAVLEGGTGDDTYVVGGTYTLVTGTVLDDCGDPVTAEHLQWYTDTVVEYGGEGYDIVTSSASCVLTDNVEELRLTFDPAMALRDPQMYAGLLTYGQDGIGNNLDNVIIGDELANRLIGGAGDDTLMGGTGDDRYVFRLGDGADTIIDSQGHDTLYLGSDLTAADISVQRAGNDVLVSVNNTTSTSSGQASDSITISRWFALAEGVSQIEFCDATVLDRQAIAGMLDSPLASQPLANQITLEDDACSFIVPADTFINPGSSRMLSYSAAMADGSALPSWLTFDAAMRTFNGTPTNWDVAVLDLSVTATNASGHTASSSFLLDVLNVDDAPSVVNPMPDQIVTEGQALKFSATGSVAASFLSDATDTGTPDQVQPDYNNWLNGSGGNDTYIFARGDGNVGISDWDDSTMDLVQFADVLPADITVTQDQWGNVILSVSGTTDSLTLSGWISYDAARIEQVVFPDNTVWNADDIMSMASTAPTAGSDYITGTDGNDTIIALSGNDGVLGGTGDDVLIGGVGNDWLLGEGGSDIIVGGSGADEMSADRSYTDTANDFLSGGAGNDYLNSSIANDLLIGGSGDDDIYADDGNDVLLFNRGDGNDLVESDYSSNGILLAQRTDTLSLGGGISYADLSLERSGNDLLLNAGNGESLTFTYWFNTDDNKAISTLQVITEAMSGFDTQSPDPLLNRRVQQFDFVGLANQFENALAVDPGITTWQVSPHLADFSLGGSDTFAIGGDMAYLYGKNGNLHGLSEAELRAQLADAQFGTGAQALTMAGSGIFDDVDFIHGDTLTYSATMADGSALPAWLHFDAVTQTFSGTPGYGDAGVLNIAVIATDTGGLSATDLFDLDITGLNTAPVAAPDMFAVTEVDSISTVAVADLLANDTDPDAGDTLSMVGFDAVTAQGNAITRDINGNLVFDIGNRYQSLGAGQVAIDNFSYTISDSAGETSFAMVIMTINGVNDAPVVANPLQGQAATQDTVFVWSIPADAFTDIDTGDTLTYSVTLADGTAMPPWLTFDAVTQTVSGIPGNADAESLGLLVTATDSGGLSASNNFAVNVTNVNDPPVANADTGNATEDGGVVILSAATLLANDTDPDTIHGDTLGIVGITQAASGAAVSLVNGDVQYDIGNLYQSMGAGQTATDTFSYIIADAAGVTGAATVAMTITGTNDAPVVNADAAAVQEDVTLIATGNVLSNDSDVDQDTLLSVASAGIFSGSYGELALAGDGSYVYTLNNGSTAVQVLVAGQIVTDVFAYQATDGIAATASTLTITIDGSNDGLVITGTGCNDTLVGTAYDDTLNGLAGADTLKGGAGNDTYIVDNTCDAVTEIANQGVDTVLSSVTYTLGSCVENLTLTGTRSNNGTGNTLDNLLVGNNAVNTLTGDSGNDLLNGGAGNDKLKGGAGNDVLEGANGNDTLTDNSGKNLFNGGNGTDKLIGCSGNELYIGGTGNDTLTTGTGADIIAFNRGDGQDTVVAPSTGSRQAGTADNTLSLGGGIDYQSLAMSKSGKNLILRTEPATDSGQADQITLQNWYSGTGNHSIANLQLVLDAGSYNASSTDPLLNQQVQSFDFAALAQAFDQALAANPTLTAWNLTDTLLSAHLAGSDTAALGGDLAYQYNLNGSLTGIGLGSAQTVINDASFGVSAQQLHPLAELQTGTARLG
ncbi:MAG: putative Ig domain-containing protein [Gallionella sp.]|nr:putative Ig domain-containing protein [Gallionella sp.]